MSSLDLKKLIYKRVKKNLLNKNIMKIRNYKKDKKKEKLIGVYQKLRKKNEKLTRKTQNKT